MLTVDRKSGTIGGMARPLADGTPGRATLAVAAWLDTCRSSNTRAAYRSDLTQFAVWCQGAGDVDLLAASADDIARYRTACEMAGAAPSTVARRLSAIASFAAHTGRGTAREAVPKTARPAVEPSSTADPLTDYQADTLLEAADRLDSRHGALVRLLMLDGLKVGEAVAADADDVAGRSPRLRLTLRSRPPRVLSLDPDTARVVSAYLGRRRTGPLFLNERRGRVPERLTRYGVDYLVKQVARAAGLASPLSANTLRRRYMVAAYAGGAAVDEIRHQAGHSSIRTTRRYLADPPTEPTTGRRGS
jgi:integrase/recombinase XerD